MTRNEAKTLAARLSVTAEAGVEYQAVFVGADVWRVDEVHAYEHGTGNWSAPVAETAPDFHAMSDAEFEAHWDKRALDAANHADLTGDNSQVEAVKEAYGDAIFDRHVATDLAIDMANDIARDIAGVALASQEESTPTEPPEPNGEPNVASSIPTPNANPSLKEIASLLDEADRTLSGANGRIGNALDDLVGPQSLNGSASELTKDSDHMLLALRSIARRLVAKAKTAERHANRLETVINPDAHADSAGESPRLIAA